MRPKPTMIGQRFGRLLVLSEDPVRTRACKRKWVCQCDCGKVVSVTGGNMQSGASQSCGCQVKAATIKRNTTHGYALKGHESPEYAAWKVMKQRCYNPNTVGYPNYGGRGITICPEWSNFETFLRDMGVKPSSHHSLDRIDTNGPYSAANCRWATNAEQSRNTRANVWVTHNGQTMVLSDWSRETGIPVSLLSWRLHRGWSLERLFSRGQRRSLPGS